MASSRNQAPPQPGVYYVTRASAHGDLCKGLWKELTIRGKGEGAGISKQEESPSGGHSHHKKQLGEPPTPPPDHGSHTFILQGRQKGEVFASPRPQGRWRISPTSPGSHPGILPSGLHKPKQHADQQPPQSGWRPRESRGPSLSPGGGGLHSPKSVGFEWVVPMSPPGPPAPDLPRAWRSSPPQPMTGSPPAQTAGG